MKSTLVVTTVVGLTGLGPWSCAAPRLAYTPDDLRQEVHRRAPGLPPSEVVVPHEITPAQGELARRLVGQAKSDEQSVRLLVEALFDHETPGSESAPPADENCVTLASRFIGLARAAGLKAFYMDASTRIHETRYRDDEGMTVDSGHISAVVQVGNDNLGVDFARLGRIRWYRIIDDLEALAHLYNNRGYAALESASGREGRAEWAQARRDFLLATQVAPQLAAAWNNLGLAAARLGHDDQALGYYRTAIDRDPKLAAPRNNLGSLQLRHGEVASAVRTLEEASELDPRAPHIQYNLATALLRAGDRERARLTYQRALRLRGSYPAAQAALDGMGKPPDRGTP
jgi:Flp pilus assembly protein TadD